MKPQSAEENITILSSKQALLREAVISGQEENLTLLLKGGVDINNALEEKDHLLSLALKNPNYSEAVCNILLNSEIDVTMFESYVLFVAAVQNKFDIFKKIIAKGADIYARNSKIIVSAASSGNIEMMKYILNAGIPIDKSGTDIRIACDYGHLKLVEFLINKGALFNHKNGKGNNAIMCAAMYEHLDIVQYLIEIGADINDVFEYFNQPNKSRYYFLFGKIGSQNPIVQDWCLEYIKRKNLNDSLEQSLSIDLKKKLKDKI